MIRRGLSLAALFAALAAPAIAQARCLPDRAPTLDASYFAQAKAYTLEWDVSNGPDRAPTTYHPSVQELVLKSGERLEVLATGCRNHGNQYVFILSRSERSIDDLIYWLERATRLLDQIAPANLDKQVPLQAITDLLRTRAATGRKAGSIDPNTLSGSLTTGPKGNRWSFGVQPVGDKAYLTLNYEFEP